MKKNERFDNKALSKVIKKQIRFCLRKRNFSSQIFVSKWIKKNIVLDYINYYCHRMFVKNKVLRIMNHSNAARVDFTNGSHITVLPATDTSRASRACSVVIDSEISKELIDSVIMPRIRPPIYMPSPFMVAVFKLKPYYIRSFKKIKYIVDIK